MKLRIVKSAKVDELETAVCLYWDGSCLYLCCFLY